MRGLNRPQISLLFLGVGLILCWSAVGTLQAESPPASKAGLDWWAYREITQPEVPKALGNATSVHPIDAFIRARLQNEPLTAAPRATPEQLIRRLHYDLTGLPPSHTRIVAFANHPTNETYAALVDSLLASDHFGERWARHWLDVVRYAETNGYERDAVKPFIWKYRDWVIDAFNTDMPYDQFVREQLAGDEIPNANESSVVATGMLRAGTWNDEPNDPHEYQYERLEDLVDVVGTAFLGITVKCARCHDHKFDPIPQRDYYRFAAAFWPGAIPPGSGGTMGGPNAEQLGYKDVFGWTDLTREPAPFHLLIKGDPHRPGEVIKPGHLTLAPWLDTPLKPGPPEAKTTYRRLQMAAFITDKRNPLTARVMVNRIWQALLGRGLVGTPNNFGFKADPPTHPELLDWLAADFMDDGWKIKPLIRQIVLTQTYQQSSIHPLEHAQAEIDSTNRLYWRANRRRLDAESLRDSFLVASGEMNWHRGGPSFYPVMAPEVLEGFSRKAKAWTPSPRPERMRRSIYMMSKRHLLLPLMTAFDFPNSEKPCGRRDVTTVAPQALALLNNAFVHGRSEAMASRILAMTDDEDDAITQAWLIALGRHPTQVEHGQATRHLATQKTQFEKVTDRKDAADSDPGKASRDSKFLALASLCHVLFNTNEFVYVD